MVAHFSVCGTRIPVARRGAQQCNRKNQLSCSENGGKKGKEGEFSLALVVAASLVKGREGDGGGGLRLGWCQELAHVVVQG
jgi:hypothetical protein